VVGAVIGVGLFVLLLCLLGVLRKNRAAVKQTIKAYMKFEFRLGVEMSTPVGSRRPPKLAPLAAVGGIHSSQVSMRGILSGTQSSSWTCTGIAASWLCGTASLVRAVSS
jgi:hypothetical protein